MKLISLVTLIISGLVVADNRGTCKTKHPHAFDAINRFCSINNLSVPSNFAANGQTNGPRGLVKAWIDSTLAQSTNQAHTDQILGTALNPCRPAQWIPKEYCFKQFYAMCAASRDHQLYGKANCQTWRIRYGGPKKATQAPKVVPAPKPKAAPAPKPKWPKNPKPGDKVTVDCDGPCFKRAKRTAGAEVGVEKRMAEPTVAAEN